MNEDIKKNESTHDDSDVCANQNESNSAVDESAAQDDTAEKKAAKFTVNLDHEINKIPDYNSKKAIVKKPKNKSKMIKRIILICVILLLSISLACAIIFVSRDIFGMGKEDKTIIVEVEQGWGMNQIADKLEEKGVIQSAFLFKAYYKLQKLEGDFKVGTYTLNANMSYTAMVQALSEYGNNENKVSVMFKEGSTVYDMAQTLEKNNICTATEFINALQETNFNCKFEQDLDASKQPFYRYEGFLFPDTYDFVEDQNPVDVAATILNNTDKKLTAEIRSKIKASGYSLNEFMTLASIVQAEGTTEESMKDIASVYINRLDNAAEYPKLQSDPTYFYAQNLKKQMKTIDNKMVNAYDTYECSGLPVGAICNPGMQAIEATLAPSTTNYYFFCSTKDMKTFYYAETFSEHQKNLKKAGLR